MILGRAAPPPVNLRRFRGPAGGLPRRLLPDPTPLRGHHTNHFVANPVPNFHYVADPVPHVILAVMQAGEIPRCAASAREAPLRPAFAPASRTRSY